MASKRDKILKTAENLVQKGKVEQAIREYQKLLAANPEDSNTINRVGDLFGRIGQVDKAVELYERIANKFAGQGFTPKAIAIYKKINRLAPHRLDIFERLGELYSEQGLTVEAKNQFRMLAEHYVKNDDVGPAIRIHERLVALDPGDHTTRLKLADLLLESGDTVRAMAEYGALGESLIQRNQLDEAERLYRRLLAYDLPDGEIVVGICDLLLAAGRTTAAQEFLTAGLGVSPGSVPLRTLQVRTHLALGEREAAEELALKILETDPENPEVRGLVGNILMSDGDETEAAEMMIPAAEALLEQADYSRAQKMLKELVKVVPTDERVLRLAIRAFRPSGDQEMLFSLTTSLADVCFLSGQEDQAKRFYMELVASEPGNQLFRERLARLDGVDVGARADAVTSGLAEEDVPEAIDFVLDSGIENRVEAGSSAEDSLSPGFDPDERIAEAAVFAKYGLNDKAVAHLEGVVRHIPTHVRAREALTRLYVEVGQRDLAAAAARPVIDDYLERGDTATAREIEALVGVSVESAGDQDDDVIILDLDESGPLDFAVDDPGMYDGAGGDVDFESVASEIDADDLVLSDIDLGGATDALFDADVSEAPDHEPSTDLESEVVDEELVEISTGVSGPPSSEIDQLDFFIAQELYDDAASIIRRLEAEYPQDGDLADRRRRLEAKGVMDDGGRAAEQTPEELFEEQEVEDYIDLAKELEEELAEEEAMVDEATGRGKGEALLEEVFREFQKGVAEQLSDEDSDTHFNLGIAYKEMGLVKEAIGEFKVASHDPKFFVEACTMIGVCSTDEGKWGEAVEWYQKALVAPNLTADARTALRYELASALEQTGEFKQAVDLLEEIVAHDPSYRDSTDRLNYLTHQERQVN